jgi:tetratricopeptide (TPR) repeat protein
MDPTSLLDQAVQMHRSGWLAEAEGLYLQVIQADPTCADAWYNLGVVALQQGRLDAAEASLQKAIQLRPQYAEAHSNMGTVFLFQGKTDRAIDCYQSALRLQPGLADAHCNLGKAYQDLRRYPEAAASARRALELAPHHVGALTNLRSALQCLGRLDEAVAWCEWAVSFQPQSADACLNLGLALFAQGKAKDAVACFGQALLLRPDFPEAHWCRSVALLQEGDFERGWPEYEWRWLCQPFTPRSFTQPLWDGSPLGGKTILIHAEQGLGDTIQFVRYASLVKQRGGRVVLACPEPLIPLLRSCKGIDQLLSGSQRPLDFSMHAPLMSLPMIFGTALATVPAEIPYLAADIGLVDEWHRELERLPGLRVGIGWQGSPSYWLDAVRSVPVAHFVSLARVPGVSLISLQKGPDASQLAEARKLFPVEDWTDRLDVAHGAFMDTAAIMKGLDLVIVSDSAVAHLAGALGVPVWVALPYSADFRWLLNREDSPWYPTMRLFRQPSPGDWAWVFDQLAECLAKLCEAEPRSSVAFES